MWRSGRFPSFGREVEQVGSRGGPGGFRGESGDVLVGLIELCDGVGSEELFGCDVEAVGVALDPWKSRAAGSLSSCSTVLAETGASSRAMICCSVSVGVHLARVGLSGLEPLTSALSARLGQIPARSTTR